ncbi:ATP-binding protein [Pantanalinema sp. GBBB05]|uniref:ATP-binding protein n=1 Tax=Pantanalinema sp. GBBB05 TaxID=2604139 RepID=UPI001D668E0E|nr:ATP-binding protein [Pantanalinema sp. GBBB05]
MVANPFIPEDLVGRQAELQQVSQILAADGDLLIAGVPGSGRRTVVRFAAQAVGARMIEIDCLRATDSNRFLHLIAESLLTAFKSSTELALIQRWSSNQPLILEQSIGGHAKLVWHSSTKDDWRLFQILLTLPQVMAEWLSCRIVLVFENFPHIRSWDRSEQWERYLRQEIQQQSRVSYALIATTAENWVQHSNMQIVFLPPLQDSELQLWLVTAMASQGLKFEPDSQALKLFLSYVQGNLGDAIALARRIWLDYRALNCDRGNGQTNSPDPRGFITTAPLSASSSLSVSATTSPTSLYLTLPPNVDGIIQAHHVHRSALALVEDLSITFESLILLLPSSQVRVLESLALDPTDSPHSREYIQKHQLSRGGGLQGALASLQQKGLVYGAEHGYRITMPLLAFWLKHRLT